jgi:hypothetical protein
MSGGAPLVRDVRQKSVAEGSHRFQLLGAAEPAVVGRVRARLEGLRAQVDTRLDLVFLEAQVVEEEPGRRCGGRSVRSNDDVWRRGGAVVVLVAQWWVTRITVGNCMCRDVGDSPDSRRSRNRNQGDVTAHCQGHVVKGHDSWCIIKHHSHHGVGVRAHQRDGAQKLWLVVS